MTYAVRTASASTPGFRVPAVVVDHAPFSVCAVFAEPGQSERRAWFDRTTRQMRGLDGSSTITLVEDDA